MHTIIRNLRYGWRQLHSSPEFTVLAVLTLALGIGANTAMFTVVESVLLRPLPYADSDRLVYIAAAGADSSDSVSWLDYCDIRQSRSLQAVAGYSNDVGVVQGKDVTVSVTTSEVTPNLFGMLGVQPLLGRTFVTEEGQPGGPPAVLLSEGLWRTVLGADPAAVGRNLRVNGRDRIVVGVMSAAFRFPESAGQGIQNGVWLPMQPTAEMLQDRGYNFFTLLAKPASSAAIPQVQAELQLIARRIRETDSRADRSLAFRAISYRETVTGPVRSVFLALVAALGLVLLIACANVANLLVARCLGRQHEFAVRAALGAGRGRLVGQMVVEAGLLSLLGSVLGCLVAYWITAAIHKLPPGTIPRAEAIEVHWNVVLALAVIATLTTLLSALLPAAFVAGADPHPVLQTASRSLGTKSFKARVGGWLVAGEVALSVLLLVATGLLFRSLWSLEHSRLGFDTARVTSFTAMPADASGFGNVTAADSAASVAATVYKPLLDAIHHAPGIQSAVLVTAPPLSGVDMQTSFHIVGRSNHSQRGLQARMNAVSGGYEQLMGTPLLRGRGITELDTAQAPFVATVNETFARKYFAGQDALGQQVDLGGRSTGMLQPYTIVGVLGDQIDTSTSQPPKPLIMLPYRQIPATSLFYPALLKTVVHFLVKTRSDTAVAPVVRGVFRKVAPDLALDNFQTMQQAVDQSNFGARLGLYLIAAFAGLAVLMVIAGLYSVLAQVVSHRRREFGVRMALGASRQTIVGMVLQRGLGSVALGLAVGIALALSTGRMMRSFLYAVKPLDGGTYLFVVIAILAVGTLAALVPAWRAASLEPVRTLRDE